MKTARIAVATAIVTSVLVGSFVAGGVLGDGATAAAADTVVRTDNGLVSGRAADGYDVYSGIPFAAAPVGRLRWQPPRPAQSWPGVREATKPSTRCAQTSGGGRPSDEEDCLHLDVTTPTTSGRKPVMVWLHGGGNSFMNASDFDPHRLAVGGNVVVVSINFRLGVFGNFGLPQLGDAPTFGLEDQQAALRWVRRNAAAFGGDPTNVTLFGESGGGYDVCAQLTSPGARGLFRRAIIQSGSCSMTWPVNGIKLGDPAGSPWISMQQLRSQGTDIAAKVGCTNVRTQLQCLRGVPAATLKAAGPTAVTTPVGYGNRTLPERPDGALKAGHFPRIPIMSGTTKDEAALTAGFIPDNQLRYSSLLRDEFGSPAVARIQAHYPAKDTDSWAVRAVALTAAHTDRVWACGHLADDRLLSKHTTTYTYEFADRDAPVGFFTFPTEFPHRAYHSSEVTYFFDQGFPFSFRPDQQLLSDQLIRYWARFAATGDPNQPGQPRWAPFDGDNAQSLAPGAIGRINLNTTHNCAFWSTVAR